MATLLHNSIWTVLSNCGNAHAHQFICAPHSTCRSVLRWLIFCCPQIACGSIRMTGGVVHLMAHSYVWTRNDLLCAKTQRSIITCTLDRDRLVILSGRQGRRKKEDMFVIVFNSCDSFAVVWCVLCRGHSAKFSKSLSLQEFRTRNFFWPETGFIEFFLLGAIFLLLSFHFPCFHIVIYLLLHKIFKRNRMWYASIACASSNCGINNNKYEPKMKTNGNEMEILETQTINNT